MARDMAGAAAEPAAAAEVSQHHESGVEGVSQRTELIIGSWVTYETIVNSFLIL